VGRRDPHSIRNEPHLRGRSELDPSEVRADVELAGDEEPDFDARVEHSVWNEPHLRAAGVAPPDGDGVASEEAWWRRGRAATGAAKSWGITLAVVALAGVWAVVGAVVGQFQFRGGLGAIGGATIVAPLTEELMKVALPLWIVEKRPFWYRSWTQIVVCGLAGGLGFAAIENLMYLHVYFPAHGPAFAAWRWTVCVALHVTCATIAAVGVARCWAIGRAAGRRPPLAPAAPWLIAAMVIHGGYNFVASVVPPDLG